MSPANVRYTLEGQVAVVTLDNPPMNALDPATKQDLATVFTELYARQAEIRAVVLTGAGEKAFVAGADIKSFPDLTPASARQRLTETHRIYRLVEDYPWPVIAAIHGFCLGGGLELALCCDLRYAGEEATFGFPEVKLSIFPGNGGTARGLYFLTLGRLKELVYTGRNLSAAEALDYGLIERVTPTGGHLDAALETAAVIAKRGPLGVAAAKRTINRARDLWLEEALKLETENWAALTATEDMKEGARAFIDKRKPEYKGR
ncbi:MAG: enoyl-CoA hydratase/isomerase family protein [Deltaproteobacteria bacterium]|nr:enoyl-CoA hydratase/isomerase family protein [Deltaproteobacteria bacterium]